VRYSKLSSALQQAIQCATASYPVRYSKLSSGRIK